MKRLGFCVKSRIKEDSVIAKVWRRSAPPNIPFLFALKGLSVQADNWYWLAQQDRQRFAVPYAERLSKRGYAVQAGLLYEATIPLGQANANYLQPECPSIKICVA